MFIKKTRVSRECADYVNKIESNLANTPTFPTDGLVHFLGQHKAFMEMYNFIMKTNDKSDEIAIEDIIAFTNAEGRKASAVAYSYDIGLNFPYDKRLALGQVMAYKTVEQILLNLKTELDKADSDSD